MRPLHIHITYERYAVGMQPSIVSEAPKHRADRSLGSPSISFIYFEVIPCLSNVALNKKPQANKNSFSSTLFLNYIT